MALYTPIDYNKKAKKGMKSLEKMAKGAVAGGAVAYGAAKSAQRDAVQNKRKNPNHLFLGV